MPDALPPTSDDLAAILGRPRRRPPPPAALAAVTPADPFVRRLAAAAVLRSAGLPDRAFDLLVPGGATPGASDAWLRLAVVSGVAAGRLPEVSALLRTHPPRTPSAQALLVEAFASSGAETLAEVHAPEASEVAEAPSAALAIASSLVKAGAPSSAGPFLDVLETPATSSPPLALHTAVVAIAAGRFALARRLLALPGLPPLAGFWRARLALWAAQEPVDAISEAWPAPDRLRVEVGLAWLAGDQEAVLSSVPAASSDPELLCFRAEALLKQGRFDEGWQAARRASELGGDAYLAGRVLEAWGAIRSGRERGLTRDGFNGLFDGQVDRLVPELGTIVSSSRSDVERLQALAQVLEHGLWPMLGGNRDVAQPTMLRDGELVPVDLRPGVRIEARRAQAILSWEGRAASLSAFEALAEARPRDPETWCYRGEVHLWLGEWGEARASFERALGVRRSTRWAWIGLGACDLMDGDPAKALDTFAQGLVESGIPTPGPTMYVYRGEANLRLGRLDDARSDLETSVANAPTRIGGWLLLSDVCARQGDDAGERRCWLEVVERARPLLLDASDRAGARADVLLSTRDGRHALREAALGLLRGNRASARVTWGRPGEALKTMPVGDALEVWAPPVEAVLAALKQG